MSLAHPRYVLALAALAYFRCTVGDAAAFAPVAPPVVHHFTLATIAPELSAASVEVGVFPDGQVIAKGGLRGGAPGQAYVLQLHFGPCGSEAVAYAPGPAVSYAAGGVVLTEFPGISVSSSVLDGSYTADVHRAGDVGGKAVLACGALR